jgi:hypothetical protein
MKTIINELVIDGMRYRHTSTLGKKAGNYRAWKLRGKIPLETFRLVAGGLYIESDVVSEIEENGLPRKPRSDTLESNVKRILEDTKSNRTLVEDLSNLVNKKAVERLKAKTKMLKIKAKATKVVKGKKPKDTFEPDINDPNY